MKYHEYRKQGLPITSCLIESTIRQVNRRIKGTEKFWGDAVNAILCLVADRLGLPLPRPLKTTRDMRPPRQSGRGCRS
jgi:hypothetical protein